MKRNVMVILCDQLRKDFLPMYGGKAIDTPNLDILAKDGVVFDKCITQSTVCAPVRASMMTGRYVSDHKVWTNDVPFREGVEFLPERMNQEGYATGCFGKLHHTPGLDAKGFTVNKLMEERRLGDEDHYFQFLKERHPEVKDIFNMDKENLQFLLDDEDYYETFIANEAIKFIRDNKDKPTFSWVSFQGPHGPYDPPKKWRGKVRTELLPVPFERPNKDLSETSKYRSATRNVSRDFDTIMHHREAYGEMIMNIDEQIGRLITSLKDNNLYESTTIIFSADHGDMIGDMDMGEKGPYLYESQLGIPMMVTNQPGFEKGSRSDLLVGNIDIPGTALHIVEAGRGIGYSKSMIHLMNGEDTRDVNYSEFSDSIRTVDDGRYRFSYYPFENYSELYDRDVDPKELNNLAGGEAYAQIENKFLREIIEFGLIGKGVRIEAQDLVPSKKAGITAKHREFLDDFPIVFPLGSMEKYNQIKEAGLDPDYNEFCKDREILAYYGKYWL